MTSKSDRLSRIEKLAGEAESMATNYLPRVYWAWFKDNGPQLSTLLHDLAKRIKAEEEGSL